jgi:hypothetical protein
MAQPNKKARHCRTPGLQETCMKRPGVSKAGDTRRETRPVGRIPDPRCVLIDDCNPTFSCFSRTFSAHGKSRYSTHRHVYGVDARSPEQVHETGQNLLSICLGYSSAGPPKAGWPVRLWHEVQELVTWIRALGLRNPVGKFDSYTTYLEGEGALWPGPRQGTGALNLDRVGSTPALAAQIGRRTVQPPGN